MKKEVGLRHDLASILSGTVIEIDETESSRRKSMGDARGRQIAAGLAAKGRRRFSYSQSLPKIQTDAMPYGCNNLRP